MPRDTFDRERQAIEKTTFTLEEVAMSLIAKCTNPEWKSTACILCECNCGVEVQLGGDDGRHLVKVRGDDAHPASKGYACEKAHRLDFYQNGPHRLTKPLRRRSDGSFEEIDWDTAIAEVAARLSAVRNEHGGDTIFYYGGGGQGNHLPAIYNSATRAALGSIHRSSALAQEKTQEFWVARKMVGLLYEERLRALRGSVFPRQESLDVPQLPARTGDAEGDRQGSCPLPHRGGPAP